MSNYDPATDSPPALKISLNGDLQTVPEGLFLDGLLRLLGVPETRVAIELDRRIVKQSEWSRTAILEGAEIEIVHFVGGG